MWLIFTLLAISALVFLSYRFYPPFGGRSAKGAWTKSKNFHSGIFLNQIPTSVELKGHDMVHLMKDMIKRSGIRKPKHIIAPEQTDIEAMLTNEKPQVAWIGHSTTLMRVGGKTIMTDPILSHRASPFPFAGPQRNISTLLISAKTLPDIDVVVISHDHYDHLDHATIRKLRHKTKKFFVPLGVAAHLRTWGVRDDQIVELDWWDESTFEGVTFTCTPARHFSGRTVTDRNKTLWASWVIHASDAHVFFSGDTGYGPHFKQIGEKYGPFDITLMECGQYNKLWGTIHMMPEQTLAAHQDLGGKRLLPVHWGAFVLSLHSWTDPVKRVRKAAEAAHVEVATPKLGEVVPIKSTQYPTSPWWEKYDLH